MARLFFCFLLSDNLPFQRLEQGGAFLWSERAAGRRRKGGQDRLCLIFLPSLRDPETSLFFFCFFFPFLFLTKMRNAGKDESFPTSLVGRGWFERRRSLSCVWRERESRAHYIGLMIVPSHDASLPLAHALPVPCLSLHPPALSPSPMAPLAGKFFLALVPYPDGTLCRLWFSSLLVWLN